MTRSRRRTPIFGNTTATSDKADKVHAHRAERAAARAAMATEGEAPHLKLFRDPWTSAKDGRHWWTKAKPEHMRK